MTAKPTAKSLMIAARRQLVLTYSIRESRSRAEVLNLIRVAAKEFGWPAPTAALIAEDVKFLLAEVQADTELIRTEVVASLRAKIAAEYALIESALPSQLQAVASLHNGITKDSELLAKVSGAMITRIDTTSHDESSRRYSALRGALADVLIAIVGIQATARWLPIVERLADGDDSAMEELRTVTVIEVHDAGHKRLEAPQQAQEADSDTQ